MAGCRGCGSRSRSNQVVKTKDIIVNNEEFSNNDDFKLVTYNGPTYSHPIASPNKVLEQYGMHRYTSRGSKGDELYVHVDDINSRPDLFVVKTEIVSQEIEVTIEEVDDVVEDKVLLDLESDVVGNNIGDNANSEVVTAISANDYAKLETNAYSHFSQVIADIKASLLDGFKNEEGKWLVKV